ncbi:MAG TPA: DMT family transporter [Ktedonobacterales bacterium]|nr:DMT family transporter [Ktedonobacterales bacterium]
MRAPGYSVLFALALIWGASFLFIKIGVEDVSPATLVFGRLAFSVLTLGAIIAVNPALAKGWRDYWRLGLLVGLANNVLPYLLIAWGETRIASGVASILNATTPLFTVMLAHWWSEAARERLTIRRAVGVLVGFVGVGVLIGPAAIQFTGRGVGQTLGEVAVLIAAAAYGVGALLSKRFGGSAPLVGPLTMQSAALLVMLPVILLWDPPTRLPSLAALGSMAELGVLATAVAYLLYFWLIRHVGPTRTALVTYLLPCTALLWGVLFLGERVSWNTFAGLLLVLLGTMVTNGTLSGLIGRRVKRQSTGEMNVAAATETSTATRL